MDIDSLAHDPEPSPAPESIPCSNYTCDSPPCTGKMQGKNACENNNCNWFPAQKTEMKTETVCRRSKNGILSCSEQLRSVSEDKTDGTGDCEEFVEIPWWAIILVIIAIMAFFAYRRYRKSKGPKPNNKPKLNSK